MLVKTSELVGRPLDWAVAKCEGKDAYCEIHAGNILYGQVRSGFVQFRPSTDWAQGGPIIEREKISTGYERYGALGSVIWDAVLKKANGGIVLEYGPTLLTAVMRCYVASKLGNEVNIPEDLL